MEYMVGGYKLKDLQSVMVQMMSEVDKLCHKYGIRYILDSGTLLGAIRHNGFIPWDDDFDILMPRDDYEKFISIVNEELPQKYCFESIETNISYPYNFGKIKALNTVFKEYFTQNIDMKHCVYIDVFPMDYIDVKHPVEVKIIKKFISILTSLRYSKLHLVNNWKYKIFGFISIYSLNKMINKVMKYHLHPKTNMVSKLCHQGPNKPPISIDYFDNVEKHQFECFEFLIPKEYNDFLTGRYGDYMKLPPVEEQVPTHKIKEIRI